MDFFATLVRIDRAGEGASYTGLKPAGRDLGPAIPAGNKALDSGSEKALVKLLTESVQDGVIEHFKKVLERKKIDNNDVEKGRAFMKAYVEFVHYVQRIYEVAKSQPKGISPNPRETRFKNKSGQPISLPPGPKSVCLAIRSTLR